MARTGPGTGKVPMNTPFITVLRSDNRFLMTSPVLPELFAEGHDLEQAIERLGGALQFIVCEYDQGRRSIALPAQVGPTTSQAECGPASGVGRRAVPFIEVRPVRDDRYLMTSPALPELIVEGAGMRQSITRLIQALPFVCGLYSNEGTHPLEARLF